ncbi:MAG: hypothetical protein JRM86_04895 [Nitrososphaerota archaeon]|nr:hypothetical protein [Nitrososphaerota archaeon]
MLWPPEPVLPRAANSSLFFVAVVVAAVVAVEVLTAVVTDRAEGGVEAVAVVVGVV